MNFNQFLNENTSSYGGRAGLTKDETLKIAQKFADAAASVDPEKGKWSVNKRTLEEDGFDLDYNSEEFDGGSYNIYKNGNVVNMALRENPVLGKVDDDIKTIAKGFKKMMANESTITEEYDVSGLSREELKDAIDYLKAHDISHDYDGREDILYFDMTELDKKGQEQMKKLGLSESVVNETGFKKSDIKKTIDFINKEIGIDPGYALIGDEDDIEEFDKLWDRGDYEDAFDFLTVATNMEISTFADVKDAIKESVVNERNITIKRQYTDKSPAVTVGKAAKVRNRMLEAIKDGKVSQEDFNNILKEMTTDSKRWLRRNAQCFNVSEDGISLSKTGSRILKNVMVSEATTKAPKIWVPGGFDKAIAKYPNSKITRKIVLDAALKWDVNPEDAIKYVEYAWAVDLDENKNTNDMKTKFIYESFQEFVENRLNEAASLNKIKSLIPEVDFEEQEIEFDPAEGYKSVESYSFEISGLSEPAYINIYDGNSFCFFYDSAPIAVSLHSARERNEMAQQQIEIPKPLGKLNKKIYDEAIAEIKEWIGESFVNVTLNEAFKSAKLANLFSVGSAGTKDLAGAFYTFSKLALDQIEDYDIIEMDPQTARKEKRANAIYFYVVTNQKENPYIQGSIPNIYNNGIIQSNTLLAITNGQNEWYSTGYNRYSKTETISKASSREDAAGFDKRDSKRYDGSGITSITKVAELADIAYVIDLDVLKSRYSTTQLTLQRANDKRGATIFMSDKDFKAENKSRYNQILAQKASAMPMDTVVLGAIDTLATQIKDALSKGEKGRYGELIVGLDPKGREIKMNDAANLMRNILDEYNRYVGYVVETEKEIASGYNGKWAEGRLKDSSKTIVDYVKKVEAKNYAW
jgi:hypothetical protein